MTEPHRSILFQNDHSILLMVDSAGFERARDELRQFAELQQAAGPYHVYRVTDLSLWSAAASGLKAEDIVKTLLDLGQNKPPTSLLAVVQQVVSRYGVLRLEGTAHDLRLVSRDSALLHRLAAELDLTFDGIAVVIPALKRGWLKATLAERGLSGGRCGVALHFSRFSIPIAAVARASSLPGSGGQSVRSGRVIWWSDPAALRRR